MVASVVTVTTDPASRSAFHLRCRTELERQQERGRTLQMAERRGQGMSGHKHIEPVTHSGSSKHWSYVTPRAAP